MEKNFPFIDYTHDSYSESEMISRTKEFYSWLQKRRSVREFSNRQIPKEVLENIILAAGTAPSGANKQPWSFCVVTNPEIKKKIRIAAEEEEFKSYNERMTDEWLEDLQPLGTNWEKPFLEIAPALIIVFRKSYDLENGKKKTNYYVNESVGIAIGFLLAAIHHAGLVSLTHTPSPMDFLAAILDRPKNEKAFLLIPIGYAEKGCKVPKITKKPLCEILTSY